MQFSQKYFHQNILLTNNDKTAKNNQKNDYSAFLGNYEMKSGKYNWKVRIDNLKNKCWLCIGIIDSEKINTFDENNFRKCIGSTSKAYILGDMTGQIQSF